SRTRARSTAPLAEWPADRVCVAHGGGGGGAPVGRTPGGAPCAVPPHQGRAPPGHPPLPPRRLLRDVLRRRRDRLARPRSHAHGTEPRRPGRGAALRLPGARRAAVHHPPPGQGPHGGRMRAGAGARARALLPEPVPVEGELPRLAARAAGGALAYVDASYRRRPAHLRPPETYAPAGFLQLDAATRRNLELLQTLGGERRGSLLWVLDQTATPMGARRLREWLLYPLLEPAAIGRRLDAVEALAERVELRGALRGALGGIGDLERP